MKISLYGIDSSPALTDKVIGTDVTDSNITKNYTLGDVYDLFQAQGGGGGFVPYINATNDVVLGTYTLQARQLISDTLVPEHTSIAAEYLGVQKGLYLDYDFMSSGTEFYALGDPFLSVNANSVVVINGVNAILSVHNGDALGFVADFGNQAYGLGDFAQVNNGTYLLVGDGLTQEILTFNSGTNKGLQLNFTADEYLFGVPDNNSIIVDNQYNVIYTQNNNNLIGLELYFTSGEYILGDPNGIGSGTYLKVDDSNQRIEITNALYTDGNTGNSGQILVSQGPVSPPQWQTLTGITPIYGSFYDTTTQTCVSGSIASMKYNTTVLSQNVFIQNDLGGKPTQIGFTDTGVYNIQFSAQLNRTTGGGDAQIDIWLRKNGVDVPYTNTSITVKANAKNVVAAWNFFESVTAGQYLEIMWTQNDAIQIIQYPADLVVPYPATPSVILTVNKIA